MLFLGYLPEHILQVANLHAFRANGEVNTRYHKKDQKNVGVHKRVDVPSEIDKPFVDIHEIPDQTTSGQRPSALPHEARLYPKAADKT